MSFTQQEVLAANRFRRRCNAEIALLGLICPEPRYRWPLAKIDRFEFSAPDTRIIARALEVSSEKGWRFCYLLARMLLEEYGYWDESDTRDFAGGLKWGPGPLLALFSRSACLPNEFSEIEKVLNDVRKLPRLPEGK